MIAISRPTTRHLPSPPYVHASDPDLFQRRHQGKTQDKQYTRQIGERIELIRLKDRFARPTSGCWSDVLVNFRFVPPKGAKSKGAVELAPHVCELQVQLELAS